MTGFLSRTDKAFPFTFIPLSVFEWYREDLSKLIGQYQPGMSYNCTLEPRHDLLRIQAKSWEAENKIKVIPLVGDQHFITYGAQDGSSA